MPENSDEWYGTPEQEQVLDRATLVVSISEEEDVRAVLSGLITILLTGIGMEERTNRDLGEYALESLVSEAWKQ